MNRSLRVLLATRIFAPEAAAATFRLSAVVRALAGAGHRVTVLTAEEPPALAEGSAQDAAPVPSVVVDRAPVLRDATGYVRGYLPYLSFDLPLAVRLARRVLGRDRAGQRPDVVLVEPPPTTGAVVRTVLAAARRLTGREVPYVYYAADVWSDATASMGAPAPVVAAMRLVERYALRGAASVVAVSAGVAERVRALAPRAAVTVVPNGIDTDVFTPDGALPSAAADDRPYLVYAGTASEWQGAEVFAEALGLVLEQIPDARVVFLGQGSSWPALRAMADDLPDGALELRPLAPPAEAAAWQRGAAAALVSVRPGVGYDFAYPTKVIAALACGTPVLFAGPGPAAADIAATPELGVAVDHDAEQVAASMVRLLRRAQEGGHGRVQDDPAARARVAWVREHRSLEATGRGAADVVTAAVRMSAPARPR